MAKRATSNITSVRALEKSNVVYKDIYTNDIKDNIVADDQLLIRDSENNLSFKKILMSKLIANDVGVDWSEVLDKPTTFNPASHSHTLSDITNLTSLTITESQISDLSHFVPTSLAVDYSFTDNSTNWNTAYGWGDHSTAGYLTSYTETDPVFTAWDKSTGISITEDQISDLSHFTPTSLAVDYSFTDNSTNWNTAYGWGDHEGLYDTIGTAILEVSTHETTYNHSHYDTAYSWGDHASVGYLTSTDAYTKTNLQTSGQASVHWDNITNTPSIGTGNVTKVGTPVDNQVGVWTGDGTLEGDAHLTWDGDGLDIVGNALSGTSTLTVAHTGSNSRGITITGDSDTYYGLRVITAGNGGIRVEYSETAQGLTIFGNSSGHAIAVYDGSSNQLVTINPNRADSGSGSVYMFDTDNSITTSTINIATFKNNGTDVFNIDKDGNVNIPTGAEYMINGTALSFSFSDYGSSSQIPYMNSTDFSYSANLTFTGSQLKVSSSIAIDHSSSALLSFTNSGTTKYTITGGTYLQLHSSTGYGINMDINGNVGINNTPNSSYELYVNGDVRVSTITAATKVVTAALQVGTSTTSGYVLTADSSGNATWAAASGTSIYGTPADDQIAVWKTSGSIEGTSGFTFDGSQVYISSSFQSSVKLNCPAASGSTAYESKTLYSTGGTIRYQTGVNVNDNYYRITYASGATVAASNHFAMDSSGRVGLGVVPSSSYRLNVSGNTKLDGSLFLQGDVKVGNYTITTNDTFLIFAGTSDATFYLPATPTAYQVVIISNFTTSHTVTIDGNGNNIYDAGSTHSTRPGYQRSTWGLICTGSQWQVLFYR